MHSWRRLTLTVGLLVATIPAWGAREAFAQCLQVLPAVPVPQLNILSPRTIAWDSVRHESVFVTTAGETWAWDGSACTRRATFFEPFRTNPWFFAAAFDAARGQIVAFGGRTSDVNATDSPLTHVWNGQTWTQAASTGPAPRGGHAMAYDPVHQRVLLVGGFPTHENCSNYFGDTWAWDGTQWTMLVDSASGPGLRGDSSMAFDEDRGVLVLFGGYASTCTGSLGDTWEFDGTIWTNRTPTPPPASRPLPSFLTSMYYNPRAGCVELVAPSSSPSVWWWNGQQWQPRTFAGQPPTLSGSYTGATFDPIRGQAIVLLSNGFVRLGDGRATVAVVGPTEYVARVGGSIQFLNQMRVAATSAVSPITYQWRRNGQPITSRFGNVNTPNLMVPSTLLASDFGEYTCAVSTSCGTTISPPITLRMACPADLTNAVTGVPNWVDDAITIEDLLYFLSRFETGNVAVDLDNGSGMGTPDGGVDINDLLYFLTHFEAGC